MISSSFLPSLALLLSSTFWGLIWYPLRFLNQGGMNGVWATGVMYSTALTIGLFWIIRGEVNIRPAPGPMVGLAVVLGWSQLSFILAVIDGNIVRVMVLFYLSPLWATLFGYFFLQEYPSRIGVVALISAMTGTLVMLYQPSQGIPWPANGAEWLALSSGFTFALANVFTRKAQGISIRTKTVVAWLGITGAALAWASQSPLPPSSPSLWGVAMALGGLGIVFTTVATQYGVTHLPLSRSATIMLFEVLVATFSAQWLLQEPLSLREWLGGGLTLLGAYLAGRGTTD